MSDQITHTCAVDTRVCAAHARLEGAGTGGGLIAATGAKYAHMHEARKATIGTAVQNSKVHPS